MISMLTILNHRIEKYFVSLEKKKFNIKQKRRKSNGDRTLIKLLKSLAIMASGRSTVSLPSDPNEISDRLKFLLQGKNQVRVLI